MTTVKVDVKQKHIDNGKLCIGNECALALAYSDAGLIQPEVGLQNLFYGPINSQYPGQDRRSARMPRVAIRFRETLDEKGPGSVHPFTFEQVVVGIWSLIPE